LLAWGECEGIGAKNSLSVDPEGGLEPALRPYVRHAYFGICSWNRDEWATRIRFGVHTREHRAVFIAIQRRAGSRVRAHA
jgi:hypothetical protein